MIHDYLAKVRKKLETIRWLIIEESIDFDSISDNLGIINGRIRFIDNSIFEFMELVNDETSYRLHYMDKNKKLIFRLDNAPHHKELPSFPHHLHTEKGVDVSKKMNLIEVLDIIVEKIIENLEP